MAYDLHITRAADWSDNAGSQITAEEWLRYVRQDRELTLEPEFGPYFARWAGPSRHDDPWLDWRDGNIYSRYPDSALLRKMARIATELGAHIQGDEGELYAGDEPLDDWLDSGQGPVLSTMEQTIPRPVPRKLPWWRRIFLDR